MSRVVPACILPAVACVALPSSAQEADAASYDCTWTASLQGDDGKRREATVAIVGYDGTRQDRTGAPRACRGKKLPITFQSSRRTVLAFAVRGEKAVRRPRASPFSCGLRASRCSMAAPTSA
jgi:hypothetical protein